MEAEPTLVVTLPYASPPQGDSSMDGLALDLAEWLLYAMREILNDDGS